MHHKFQQIVVYYKQGLGKVSHPHNHKKNPWERRAPGDRYQLKIKV